MKSVVIGWFDTVSSSSLATRSCTTTEKGIILFAKLLGAYVAFSDFGAGNFVRLYIILLNWWNFSTLIVYLFCLGLLDYYRKQISAIQHPLLHCWPQVYDMFLRNLVPLLFKFRLAQICNLTLIYLLPNHGQLATQWRRGRSEDRIKLAAWSINHHHRCFSQRGMLHLGRIDSAKRSEQVPAIVSRTLSIWMLSAKSGCSLINYFVKRKLSLIANISAMDWLGGICLPPWFMRMNRTNAPGPHLSFLWCLGERTAKVIYLVPAPGGGVVGVWVAADGIVPAAAVLQINFNSCGYVDGGYTSISESIANIPDGSNTVAIESPTMLSSGTTHAPLPKLGEMEQARALCLWVMVTKETLYNCTINDDRGALYDQSLHYFKACVTRGT